MELRATREMRRSEQLSKAMAKKAETADAPAKVQGQPARNQAPTDRVTLSRQALAYLEQQRQAAWEKKQEQLQRKLDESRQLIRDLENSKEQSEAMAESMKVMMRCLKIAASIMKGDNVPSEDMQYLMEHDPESFRMAVSLRRQKDDPEDVESVLDDEDKDSGSARRADGGGEGREAPSVQPSEGSSGGGEASASAE